MGCSCQQVLKYSLLAYSHCFMKAVWFSGLTISMSTMSGSNIWLILCLIYCRRSSLMFLLEFIQVYKHSLQLNMIRKLTPLAFIPFASSRALTHNHLRQLTNPIINKYTPMYTPSYNCIQSNRFNFSENKDNKDNDKDKYKDKDKDKDKQGNKKQNKQDKKDKKENWKEKWDSFIDNFWQKPDEKDPTKKPPSKPIQLIKKFQLVIQYLMNKLKDVYYRKFKISSILIGILAIYIINKLLRQQTELTPQAFFELVKMNSFEQVEFIEEEYFRNKTIRRKKAAGKIGNERYYCELLSFDQILNYVIKDGHIKYTNVRRTGVQVLLNQVYNVLDLFLIIFIIATIIRAPKGQMGGRQGMAPQKKKFQMVKNVNVKFADVAGLHESKRQIQQVVDFLKKPEKYHALGATIPKGVLLTGPPGTGKTLLAKACAGEAGVPFFSVSGSDFVEVFVGVGASRVRQLFHQAKQSAPSIIFIDELDAVGKKRQNKMGSNDERESTLNQLLVEMDGFGTNSSVIVMAATNRKEILDSALVRAGRFDREVQVGLPDLRGRFQILLVHLTPLHLSPKFTKEQYAKRIASLTPGFSGAEIANLCNEAAILAARCGKEIVQMMDFQLSSQRVIGGVERKGFVSIKEKKTVAYHESGHAVVSWFLQGADPLLKVTIIPRSKGSLGFAQYFLNENQLQTKQELLDRICFILGGRCAQLHFFNQVTTGAYDDLEKAYNLAYALVTKLGMDKQLGYISFPDIQYTKPYGQKVQALIDRQIKKIIDECTQKTKAMVKLYQNHIKNLAEQLLVKQTLDVRSIQKILGNRPFPINKTFQAYLETEQTHS